MAKTSTGIITGIITGSNNNEEEDEEEEEGGDNSWVWWVHSCNPQHLGGVGRKITANFLLY